MENTGFDTALIEDFRRQLQAQGRNYLLINEEDNSDEYVNFNFIGKYQGKEVIYDAAMYTLRLHYNSELWEMAEHKAAQNFPEYKSIHYDEDENGDLEQLNDLEEEIGLFMAEVIMELEEEGSVKVREHVELDPNIDFGIGLDIGLNIEKITPEIMETFVKDFNDDTLQLDETLFTFQMEGENLN